MLEEKNMFYYFLLFIYPFNPLQYWNALYLSCLEPCRNNNRPSVYPHKQLNNNRKNRTSWIVFSFHESRFELNYIENCKKVKLKALTCTDKTIEKLVRENPLKKTKSQGRAKQQKHERFEWLINECNAFEWEFKGPELKVVCHPSWGWKKFRDIRTSSFQNLALNLYYLSARYTQKNLK